jgi:hypothetical protein
VDSPESSVIFHNHFQSVLRRNDHLSVEPGSTLSFKKSVPVMPGVFHNYLVKTFSYISAKYKAHDGFKTYNYTLPINHS